MEQSRREATPMEHVWIIRTDGIVLYHDGDELNVSSDLIAGLFSAINTLASQMDENGISAMVIGQSKLSIRRAHGILFVMLHDNHLKEKKVAARLAFIEGTFFSLYPPASLAEWRGNLAHFAQLGQVIAAMP
nr:roadblock/LC7 domain-containing protein [Candidatus Sigynarchaeum springense]